MRITKKETKLMAFITTFVMMLSCLGLAPSTNSKAAGATPTVKLLGATLRLDADEGCQSMRVGIKVKNASKAKACGLELTIGENNTIKIATDAEDGTGTKKGDKIYDYDEVSDALIYTAVITNIPMDNYDTKISAKGTVTPISNGTAISTTSAEKSVNSIVDSLKTKLPNIELLDDGSFAVGEEWTSLDTSSTTSLKEREEIGNFWNWTGRENPTSNTNGKGDATVKYDDTEKALKFTTDSETGKGLSYQADWNRPGDVVYKYEVKADAGTEFMILGFDDTSSNQKYTATGDWQKISYSTTMETYQVRSLATVNPGATYYVKSCKIVQYTPLTAADFGSITLPKDFDVVLSKDTAVKLDSWHLAADKIDFDSNNNSASANVPKGQGMAFYLKEDHTPINSDDYSKIEICCSADKDTIIRTGACTDARAGYDAANIENKTIDVKAGEDITITIDLTNQASASQEIYAVLVALNWNTKEPANVTVKSIKAYV